MKRLLPLLVLLGLAYRQATAQIAPVYTARFQFILDSVCQKNKIKGVSAAILIPKEGIWQGVYGDSHDGAPLTSDMYFLIGSNTKTFTAATILKLQENGSLNINDTIGRWIQNVPNVSGQITIKQLLNHTSGLYNYTDNPNFFATLNADYTKVWQPEDMYQFIDAPLAQPGVGWSYCNTNYLLAGIIIEKVTSLDLHTAYRNLIMTSQGLNETFLFPDEQPTGTIPHGWSVIMTGSPMVDLQAAISYTNEAFLSMANAAGGIISTAEDNVKFWDKLMTGQVINSTSLAQMKEFEILSATKGYGLGLFRTKNVNGRIVYGHGGTCAAYLNENIVDSVSGVCIAVLSNQDSVQNNILFTRLATALHKATLQMPPAGIQDINTKQPVVIYPNPSTGTIAINLANHPTAEAEVCDMTGRTVFSCQVKQGTNKISANLPQGLYIARVTRHGTIIHSQKLEIIQ